MNSLYKEKIWAQIQEDKEDGKLEEFTFECELGTIIYRFFIRHAGVVANIEYFDIASYRGAEGPYIENCNTEDVEELLNRFDAEFDRYCVNHNIIAEFAKLDPWDSFSKEIREHYNAEYYGNFYCNHLDSDFYKEEYNRRSKRSIKKAKEAGVTVYVDYEGKTINDFLRLYENTEEKYKTSNYYNFSYRDIKKYFDLLNHRVFLINAVYNNEIITSVLTAYGEDVMHYLFLGNNPNYLELQGNSLLTYETSLIGQKLNLKLFDMGGGKPGGNIETFKRNFITDEGVYKYYAIKKIRNNYIYNELVNQRKIKNINYFPLYKG